MFWHSLKSQYFSRQNHIYNNQHFVCNHNEKDPFLPPSLPPLPQKRTCFLKITWEEKKGIQVLRWLCGGGGQTSHPRGPPPTHLHLSRRPPGWGAQSWCLIKRTISLQKTQGTTHNPNKVAVHSRTGDFRACYPWANEGLGEGIGGLMGEGIGGGWVGVKDLTQLMPEQTSHHWFHELQ